jgi:hypothetical protein
MGKLMPANGPTDQRSRDRSFRVATAAVFVPTRYSISAVAANGSSELISLVLVLLMRVRTSTR